MNMWSLTPNTPNGYYVSFGKEKFAFIFLYICLSYARSKGSKLSGGVKEQKGVLRSTFGQNRVRTNRTMKKRHNWNFALSAASQGALVSSEANEMDWTCGTVGSD
jgi:hypothetical protein